MREGGLALTGSVKTHPTPHEPPRPCARALSAGEYGLWFASVAKYVPGTGKEGCPSLAPLRGGWPREPGRDGRDAKGMWSEEARIGESVRVRGEAGLPSELRGLLGTVSGTWANPWGAPEDLVLEVRLADGRTRLFWHHELEGVAKGA